MNAGLCGETGDGGLDRIRGLARRVMAAGLCVALLSIPDAAAAQDDRNGFYAGLQLGAGLPTAVKSDRHYVSYPTRCDRLLYPPSLQPPADDPACLDNTPKITSNEFDPGAGPIGGFHVGYATGWLRFELEYLNVTPDGDVSPLGATTSTALLSKTSEWSTEWPPFESIGEYRIHQAFANVYYDFNNASRWTPFVGAGVGGAAVEMNYYVQFIRKPKAEYLQIEFDPEWPEEAKLAAAGTVSVLDAHPSGNVFGYQALGGVDYALGERTSVGITLRWTRFGQLDHDTVYRVTRSHAPVRSDGVTPFSAELEFSGIGHRALTVSLRHHF